MNRPATEPTTIGARDGYDRWSAFYDEDDNPLVGLEEPVFAELAGEVAGREVLDVGCGTGRHAIRLARAGARVTGIDFSPGMLARAAAKPGAEPVRFIEHDLHAALPFDGGSFDLVACCLALDHIADMHPLFAEMGRVCRTQGRIVVTTLHPAMSLRGVRARFNDPATGGKVMLDSPVHRVSDYINAAIGAGLRLDHISEHEPGDDLIRRLPRAEPYRGWPMLLAMRLAPPAR